MPRFSNNVSVISLGNLVQDDKLEATSVGDDEDTNNLGNPLWKTCGLQVCPNWHVWEMEANGLCYNKEHCNLNYVKVRAPSRHINWRLGKTGALEKMM
ncbi:hypothetical protein GOP47_0015318 [Adiantum capillus-veneris]|uniref:Uncharacterized protein n=1 Tax=Adiantum capillus-veneris TaxID=13818 RepID=A0A9D4UJT2_ADICA|nr:hypothetical protein GOP47_0015318 [Adiantum capillus-veneris]